MTTYFKHIFIVDDDPFYSSLLEQLSVPFSDSPISLFSSGADCIKALSLQPDLILLDYSMEGMNGIEVLRQIKRDYPAIQVVFVRSQEEVNVAVNSLKLGAADYLIKNDEVAVNLEEILFRLGAIRENNSSEKEIYPGNEITDSERKISPINQVTHSGKRNLLGAVLLIFLLQSCSTQNLFETPGIKTNNALLFASSNDYEYHIRKDDKISISIWNHNEMSIGSIFDALDGNQSYGKWVMVDHFGNITVPSLGEIPAEGCTIHELEDLLKASLTSLKDPVIEVKVLNKEVTLLGELRTPGIYPVEKERNSISEVIGMAGGLDIYADQKHVRIIRKEDDITQQYEVDLTRMDDFDKASLLVLPGDVINVPSRKGKMFDRKIPTVTPFISAISVIVIVYSVFIKK